MSLMQNWKTALACFVICHLGMINAALSQHYLKPQRITFSVLHENTELVGYLYQPENNAADKHKRWPAVIMMHGRSGVFSNRAAGEYHAETLSLRHKMWGTIWAEAGYIALLVDGFSPRGYPAGFPHGSYDSRPKALNEVTRRPLDAYAALQYLRALPNIDPENIGLLGWSNGGSATLAAMDVEAPILKCSIPECGFRAAISFYPGCGLKGRFNNRPLQPYAPLLLLHGEVDEETSAGRCLRLVEDAQSVGGDIHMELFADATHGFDSPSSNRKKYAANRIARDKAIAMALDFFNRHLKTSNQGILPDMRIP